MGSTMYAEACNATRILRRYGEGGTSPANTVIERVKLKEDPPGGGKVLYPFLLDWDKKNTAK